MPVMSYRIILAREAQLRPLIVFRLHHGYTVRRGGGSATATTAMAVLIVKQKVGVDNVEALKRAWHSIS